MQLHHIGNVILSDRVQKNDTVILILDKLFSEKFKQINVKIMIWTRRTDVSLVSVSFIYI